MSTLKRKVTLDLRQVTSLLKERNFQVTDVGPLLVLKKEVEITLYRNGRMIAKTDDRGLADRSVKEVYSLILPEHSESE
ncbi:MAG: hypothetical protein ACE5IJ_02825 [Thermoplasmata archaeon]